MRRKLRDLHTSLWLILGPALAAIAVIALLARAPDSTETGAPAGVYETS